MIGDREDLKHDRRPYERPDARFRCGRGGGWGTPCHRGPNPDGSCGGTTECTPFKNKQGRFECRRQASAGGPCAEGPGPDGRCSHQHPPCWPRLTIRALRGRLVLLAFGLVVGLLAALWVISGTASSADSKSKRLSPIDPGPLSAIHATLTSAQGCTACHAQSHQWRVQQAFLKSDPTPQCASCHSFGGQPSLAHNVAFAGRADLKETTCVMCHTEHKGLNANLVTINDAQCNACHTTTFRSFSDGHPAFPAQFPSDRRTAIQFDHAAHFNQHFKDARAAAHTPQSCTACHTLERASQQQVHTAGFAQACASCHAADMAKKELVLFRLPELTADVIDPKLALAACGPGAAPTTAEAQKTPDAAKPAETTPVSSETPTVISAFLLGVQADQPEAYSKPMQELILAMAKDGASPLAKLLDAHGGSPALLQGLNPELVKRAACAWAANQEYEPPAEAQFGGWHADGLELRYQPSGHADPVVKEWVEYSLRAADQTTEAQSAQRAKAMRESLLSRARGVGRCTKCHAVTASTDAKRLAVEWSYERREPHPYTVFSHGAHLNVLGKADACTTCHALNEQADYAGSFKTADANTFVSSFHPIKKETCLQCHGAAVHQAKAQQIREECLLCHTYHPPGLRQTAAKAE